MEPVVERPDVSVQSLAPATAPAQAVSKAAPVDTQPMPASRSVQPALPSGDRIAGGVYVVQRGDSLYGIARRSGVPVRELAAANRLQPPYGLSAGQRLAIPSTRYHKVTDGETLYAIAHRYKVSALEIARQNRIGPSHAVHAGQSLRLPVQAVIDEEPPALVQLASTGAAIAHVANDATAGSGDAGPGVTDEGAAPVPAVKPAMAQTAVLAPKDIPAPPRRSSSRFAWPVNGRVISGFGPKDGGLQNDGVNLAVPEGTPFRSAANGVVTYAGNEIRGFGNLVLVRHAGGWVTAYAHASQINVKVGQTVKRGQILGRAGATGHVTSPQLHFEIRRGRNAVDPMLHLAPLGQERVAFSRSGPADDRQGPG